MPIAGAERPERGRGSHMRCDLGKSARRAAVLRGSSTVHHVGKQVVTKRLVMQACHEQAWHTSIYGSTFG